MSRRMRAGGLAALVLTVGSCGPPAAPAPRPAAPVAAPAPVEEAFPPADAAAGVHDETLSALLVRHWGWALEEAPVWATQLGVHRFDDRIAERADADVRARRVERDSFRAEAHRIAADALEPADRTTLALFQAELDADAAMDVCELHLWNLSVRDNPVARFGSLPDTHPVTTPRDADTLLSRYRAIPRSIQSDVDNLTRGLREGLTANRRSVELVIDMVARELDKPTAEWALARPAADPHPAWDPGRLDAFRAELLDILERQTRPALERYLTFVRDQVLPAARGDAKVGVGALPFGDACYRATILQHVTEARDPDAIHAVGLAEIARLDDEILALGRELLGETTLAGVLARLRSDRALFFATEAEIVTKAEMSLAAANGAVPRAFGLRPRADCVVRRIPDFEAPFTTIAYYRPPVPDGSKPGEYFVNVFEPSTRPRFEAAVLAFHESVPGHHLQIAIAQELGELPAFRKNGIVNAFVEGWALYTERLADELGLYPEPLDRMGMLSFDAWRASRLVVDTGIHHQGWTRERAETFMRKHTALADANIANEVDRYIAWPGQALAYKSGQLEILALRSTAERALGTRYVNADFHDAVLGRGPVTLPVLREGVLAFIEERAPAGAR